MPRIPARIGPACIAVLLAMAAHLGGQQAAAPGQKAVRDQKASQDQKAVQDQAENKAYTDALNTQDATERAEAFAAFAQQYPKSAVLTDALQQEMAAWQTAGDSGQVMKVAKQLLAADPGNIRVLGIVVALDRVSAEHGDLGSLNEMCQDASGGMLAVPMWRKPENMTEDDYVTLSKLMSSIFFGAEGYCAVEQKNYSQGKEWLTRALKIDPTNAQNSYQLAIADLSGTPADPDGIWYCARAIHLTESVAIPQDVSGMVKYCKAKYADFHGAEDGWDALVQSTGAQDAPAAGFAKSIRAAK